MKCYYSCRQNWKTLMHYTSSSSSLHLVFELFHKLNLLDKFTAFVSYKKENEIILKRVTLTSRSITNGILHALNLTGPH